MIWPFAQQDEALMEEDPFSEPYPSASAALPAPRSAASQTFDFEDDGLDYAALGRTPAAPEPASGSPYAPAALPGAGAGGAYAPGALPGPGAGIPYPEGAASYGASARAGAPGSGFAPAPGYPQAPGAGRGRAGGPGLGFGSQAGGADAFKTCPQCGAQVFADMDVCYGCLYEFPPLAGAATGTGVAELLAPEEPSYPAFRLGGPAARGQEGEAARTGALGAVPSPQAGPQAGRGTSGALAPDPALSSDLEEPPEYVRTPRHLARSRDGVVRVEQAPPRPVPADATAPLNLGAAPRVPAVDDAAPATRWTVLVHSGETLVRCAVPPQGLRVGRDPDNDVVLNVPSVSRRHLRICAGPSGLRAEDLQATNPAQINGVPLVGSAPFGAGDTLDVCGTQLCAVCAG